LHYSVFLSLSSLSLRQRLRRNLNLSGGLNFGVHYTPAARDFAALGLRLLVGTDGKADERCSELRGMRVVTGRSITPISSTVLAQGWDSDSS